MYNPEMGSIKILANKNILNNRGSRQVIVIK